MKKTILTIPVIKEVITLSISATKEQKAITLLNFIQFLISSRF